MKPASGSAVKAKNSNSVVNAEQVDDEENPKAVLESSPDKSAQETSKMRLLNDKENEDEEEVATAKIEQVSNEVADKSATQKTLKTVLKNSGREELDDLQAEEEKAANNEEKWD